MQYQFAHLFIYTGKNPCIKTPMYFYTDHDMSRGDKTVSTIVSLMAISVFVSVCECFKSINTSPYLHKADLSSMLGFTSQNTNSAWLCVYLHTFSFLFTSISCSYLASFPGQHVLLLQSHLMRIGAETCNTQYLNTNPTCSAVQPCLYALK